MLRFFISTLAYATTLIVSKVASAAQNTTSSVPETLGKMDTNLGGNTANTAPVTNSTAPADLGIGIADSIPDSTQAETIFSWGSYFQAIAVMFLLLGVLWLGLHLLRRSGKFSFFQNTANFSRTALSIESQIALAPKKSLVMVRFLNNHILLGVTEHNITFLKEVPIHDDQHERIQENPLSTKDIHQTNAGAKAFEHALHHAKLDAEHNPEHKP